ACCQRFLRTEISGLEEPALLYMPEGPAVARRRVLERRADLVDRPTMLPAAQRSVGPNAGSPPALGIEQGRPRRHEPAFDEQAEGDARLFALVGSGAHRARVERKRRIDPLARDLRIGVFALDPDPP